MDTLPYWISLALKPLPALAWMVAGLGLPWALALLPRRDWRHWPLVALVMFAAGPVALTLWMLVLGTIGGARSAALLTHDAILAGSVAIAAAGVLAAVWKWRRTPAPLPEVRQPLARDERLLVLLIAGACVLRWLAAVWYPFWEYDPLWVYGYEGRLYTLLGHIPQDIGYYPQFLPLQYAYAQVMTGVLDDHVARAAFPLYHWGSILAAYALGRLTVSRRVGVYLAALWALYPHVGQWATTGDLEIPLAFAVTGAAAFFLKAWQGAGVDPHTRAYALLSGGFVGLALWTKPTGGALILGIVLLVAAEAVRVRFVWRRWLPRFMVAFWCGLASIPLGAVWYVRNIALGHRAIDFPNSFWLTQAMRSGAEFGWPLLAAGLLCLWLLLARGVRVRPDARRLAVGWLLLAAALGPSILAPRPLMRMEWALLLAGSAVLAWALLPLLRHATAGARRQVDVAAAGLLLALPYFCVWFLSYSYHYRLSFAIVPLLALPSAVILARWLPDLRADRSRRWPLVAAGLVIAAMPAILAPLHDTNAGWGYLWSADYPDDGSRLYLTNPGLHQTVELLKLAIAGDAVENPVIVAPGLQRLPFFFPLDDVRIHDVPTRLEELEGVDFYIYTQEARWLYVEQGLPEVNQVTGSLQRPQLLYQLVRVEDASFFGEIYRVGDLSRRFVAPEGRDTPPQAAWPFARLSGLLLTGGDTLGGDVAPQITLDFLATETPPLEYTLYIHLLAPDDSLIATWDTLPLIGRYTSYATRLWEAGEYVSHTATLALPEGVELADGVDYRLKIGWYDYYDDNRRVPVKLDAGAESDGVVLPYRFHAPVR